MRCLIIVLAACLALPASAAADPGKSEPAKRHLARKAKGFGFLPGYQPPARRPLYGESYAEPRYWYRGEFRYGYGGPGFYRGRWNGGGFGPCWTRTPIGPIWDCGK